MASTNILTVDLSESKQNTIRFAVAVSYALAVLFVGLRLLSRRLINMQFWLDDWLALASLLPLTGGLIDSLYWVKHGVGRHIELFLDDLPHVIRDFFIGMFVGWIVYTITICMAKFAVLALYWRIFKIKSIRLPIYILTGVVTAMGIVNILVTVFQCQPISAFWNRTTDNNACKISNTKFFVATSVINVATDISILALPIPYIWKMPRSKAQKVTVSGMFLLGGCVCIIATIRLGYLIKNITPHFDLTWEFSSSAVWTLPECAVAIMSACLPCLRPVYLLLTGRSPKTTSEPSGSREGGTAVYASLGGNRPPALSPSWRGDSTDTVNTLNTVNTFNSFQPLLSPFPMRLGSKEEYYNDTAYPSPTRLGVRPSPESPLLAAFVKPQHQVGVRIKPIASMDSESWDCSSLESDRTLRNSGGSGSESVLIGLDPRKISAYNKVQDTI